MRAENIEWNTFRFLESTSWYPQGDSNARSWLRRPVLYPLSYGGLFSFMIPDRCGMTTDREASSD